MGLVARYRQSHYPYKEEEVRRVAYRILFGIDWKMEEENKFLRRDARDCAYCIEFSYLGYAVPVWLILFLQTS